MKNKTIIKIFLLTCAFMLLISQSAFAQPAVTLNATVNEGYVHLDWNLSVDTSVYNITYFNIYRSNTANFTANDKSLLVEVYNAGLRSYDDYSITANQAVYYQLQVIDAVYGAIALSRESNSNANARNPHGYYDSKTTKCSICHDSHKASAPGLVNMELNSMEDLCKICHEAGGVSSLVIDKPKENSSMQNCNTCHNPHGNNANREFVPGLLQVTIGGKVYFSATDLKNGVGNGFCLVPACHNSEKYPSITEPSYKPPANDPHGNNAMVDKQLQAGQTNNTKISCNGCHSKHNSNTSMYIRKQVYWNDKAYNFTEDIIDNKGYPITNKYNEFCLSCHEDAKELWTGKKDYNDNTKNGHSEKACSTCHDPHGRDGRDKYLIDKYAFDNSSSDTTENSFQLCFTCHESNTVLGNSKFSGTVKEEVVNLHTFHLQGVDADKRAICSDCHNPHGVNTDENPAGIKNIGFLSAYPLGKTYLKPNAYTTPKFINNPLGIDEPNRACSLTCHGVKHSEQSVSDGVYAVYKSSSSVPPVGNSVLEPNGVKDKVYNSIPSLVDNLFQVDNSVYQAVY